MTPGGVLGWLRRRTGPPDAPASAAADARARDEVLAALADAGYRTPAPMTHDAFDRIRARVLAGYAEAVADPAQAALAAADMTARPALPARRFLHRGRVARLGATLTSVAVSCLLVTGGVAAETAPGHSLYPIRMALETLTLPRGTTDRVNAQLARLDTRVHEAETALAAGDRHAVDDALTAYRDTLPDVAASAVANPAIRPAVVDGLRAQTRALARAARHATGTIHSSIASALADACAARGTVASVASAAGPGTGSTAAGPTSSRTGHERGTERGPGPGPMTRSVLHAHPAAAGTASGHAPAFLLLGADPGDGCP